MLTILEAQEAIEALWENHEDPIIARDIVIGACQILVSRYTSEKRESVAGKSGIDGLGDIIIDAVDRANDILIANGFKSRRTLATIAMMLAFVQAEASENRDTVEADAILMKLVRSCLDISRDVKRMGPKSHGA
jgi:hypothetical protein